MSNTQGNSQKHNDQLLPCPFCGGEEPVHDESDTAAWVECPTLGCGACGPLVPNGSVSGRERAAQAWNTRAQLPERGAVPDGWKLVPIKPTAEMKAVCRIAGKTQVWADMIAASPAAPHPVSGEQKPVALRFPTMLRKMWSGGEVQDWLDRQGPLYAAPPAAQDVSGLVEAVERALREAVADDMDDWYSNMSEALTAHRAQAQGGSQ